MSKNGEIERLMENGREINLILPREEAKLEVASLLGMVRGYRKHFLVSFFALLLAGAVYVTFFFVPKYTVTSVVEAGLFLLHGSDTTTNERKALLNKAIKDIKLGKLARIISEGGMNEKADKFGSFNIYLDRETNWIFVSNNVLSEMFGDTVKIQAAIVEEIKKNFDRVYLIYNVGRRNELMQIDSQVLAFEAEISSNQVRLEAIENGVVISPQVSLSGDNGEVTEGTMTEGTMTEGTMTEGIIMMDKGSLIARNDHIRLKIELLKIRKANLRDVIVASGSRVVSVGNVSNLPVPISKPGAFLLVIFVSVSFSVAIVVVLGLLRNLCQKVGEGA